MINSVSRLLILGSLATLAACSSSTPPSEPATQTFTSAATANVAENSIPVITVVATDAEGDTLTYSISGGTDQTIFSINSSTGALVFDAEPDFETPTDGDTNNAYVVQVSVTDGVNSTSQTITVTVTNVNEAGPVITSSNAVNVDENTTVALTVTASDADNDTLTYSLSGGTDQARFSINSSSGVLSFVSAPDSEVPTDSDTNNTYVVQVSVTDSSTSVAQTITVTVDNVNEGAPVITSGNTANVAENTTAVMTVTSTDVDNDTRTYSLTGGTDDAKFSINNSGVLTFVSAPDFEAPTDANTDNDYVIQVAVGDGSSSTFQTITVTVTDVVNEAWSAASLIESGVPAAGFSNIAISSNDNAVAIWVQSDGSENSIYANYYDASTTSWGTETLLENASGLVGNFGNVAIDSNGDAFAVWEQYDGAFYSIYVSRYTASTSIWSSASLLEVSSASATAPQIAMASNGNAIAVWEEGQNIKASLYASTTSTWSTPTDIDGNSFSALRPQIAMDASGNAIVAWAQSPTLFATVLDLWANHYNATLQTWGGATVIESNTTTDSVGYQVAMNNARGVVSWLQNDTATNVISASLFVNLYDGGWGTATSLENNTDANTGAQVAIDMTGNVFVTWMTYDGLYNTYVSRYNIGTTSWSAASLLNADNGGSDHAANQKIAVDDSGNALAVWRLTISGSNKYRRYTSGNWTAPALISGIDSTYAISHLVMNASGKAITVGKHTPVSGNSNIWSNRFFE